MGQTFWLHGIKGTVKGVQKWTSTSVQSSGGSLQRVADGVYHMNAPQISSTTNQHQEFWIVSPGGREKKIEENCDVRDGQTALVVWGSVKGNNNGYNLVVRNCTTNQGWNLLRCLPNSIAYKGCKQLTRKYLIYIFAPLSIIFTWSFITMSEASFPVFALDLFVVTPILMFVGFLKRNKLLRKNYNTAMACINQAINSNPQFVKSLES